MLECCVNKYKSILNNFKISNFRIEMERDNLIYMNDSFKLFIIIDNLEFDNLINDKFLYYELSCSIDGVNNKVNVILCSDLDDRVMLKNKISF